MTGPVERRFRIAVFAAVFVGAVAAAAHFAQSLSARNELWQVEGIVATQARSLAESGRIYYDLKQYPYTVCAYMPLFYGLSAGLQLLGTGPLHAGRLVSILALCGIFYLVWKLLRLYTRDTAVAGTGLALAMTTHLVLHWGTIGQVDILAIAFSLAAFYQYSRFAVDGEETLDSAAVLAVAGLFTKQTALAAPASIFLILLATAPRRAWRFAAIAAGGGGALVLALHAASGGVFLANTVFANMNPFAWFKLQQHLDLMAVLSAPLAIVALVGARRMAVTPMRGLLVYLAASLAVLLATASKIGSDSNYQMEFSIVLILTACASLHALEFFPLSYRGSKSPVTLLLLPLLLYPVQNLRVAVPGLIGRVVREQQLAAQTETVKPYLAHDGRVLSADANAAVQSHRRLEVEPLIYRLLVEAGQIAPQTVDQDLEAARFSTVLLYDDLTKPLEDHAEIPRLTAHQMEIVKRRYRMVKHAPGPYLGGLYVYQPVTEQAEARGQ